MGKDNVLTPKQGSLRFQVHIGYVYTYTCHRAMQHVNSDLATGLREDVLPLIWLNMTELYGTYFLFKIFSGLPDEVAGIEALESSDGSNCSRFDFLTHAQMPSTFAPLDMPRDLAASLQRP